MRSIIRSIIQRIKKKKKKKDPSRLSRFRYGIYAVSYKALLLIAGGGKYKLKVILIDSYLI